MDPSQEEKPHRSSLEGQGEEEKAAPGAIFCGEEKAQKEKGGCARGPACPEGVLKVQKPWEEGQPQKTLGIEPLTDQ